MTLCNTPNERSLDTFLFEMIPSAIALLIVERGTGNLIKDYANPTHKKEFDHFQLEFFAKLIELRHSIVDFDKLLGGLQITVNVFSEYCVFVTLLNQEHLVVIITSDTDIEKTRNMISKLKDVSCQLEAL